MANLQTMKLLDSTTNKMYELKVLPEIYNRARKNITYATELLNFRIKTGQTVYDKFPINLDEFPINLDEVDDEPIAGPSTDTDDIESTPGPSIENDTHIWNEPETIMLIETYRDNQMLFLNDKTPKTVAWTRVYESITKQRRAQGLPPIPKKKCITRMDTLLRVYKQKKKSDGSSGNMSTNWIYFNPMNELFGTAPFIQPLSTAGTDVTKQLEPGAIEPPRKRQKTMSDLCEQLLDDRRKANDAKQQRHNETIGAIKELTNVMAKLVDVSSKNARSSSAYND